MKEVPSLVVSRFDLSNDKYANKLSRYNYLKRVTNADGECYIETPNKVSFRETNQDPLYQVLEGRQNRLDLISYDFYGTPLLWWVIAMVNNISNPFDVEAGIVLRIPSIQTVYNSGLLKVGK